MKERCPECELENGMHLGDCHVPLRNRVAELETEVEKWRNSATSWCGIAKLNERYLDAAEQEIEMKGVKTVVRDGWDEMKLESRLAAAEELARLSEAQLEFLEAGGFAEAAELRAALSTFRETK